MMENSEFIQIKTETICLYKCNNFQKGNEGKVFECSDGLIWPELLQLLQRLQHLTID